MELKARTAKSSRFSGLKSCGIASTKFALGGVLGDRGRCASKGLGEIPALFILWLE